MIVGFLKNSEKRRISSLKNNFLDYLYHYKLTSKIIFRLELLVFENFLKIEEESYSKF